MKITLKIKMIIANMAVLILMVLISVFAVYHVYSRYLEKSLFNSYRSTSLEATKNINQYFRNVDYLLKMCFYNTSFQDRMLQSDKNDFLNLYRDVQRDFDSYFSLPTISILSITFDDENGNHYSSSKQCLTMADQQNIKDRLNDATTLWILGSDINFKLKNTIIIAKKIYHIDKAYNLISIGYGFIVIDAASLISQTQNLSSFVPNSLYFYDSEKNKILFSKDKNILSDSLLILLTKEKTPTIFTEKDGTKFFVSLNKLAMTDWKLVYVGEIGTLLEEKMTFLRIAVMTASIVIFLMILLNILLNSYLSKPVKEIISVIKSVSKGNFTKKAIIKSHDEFYDIAQNLNIMMDEIHSLSIRIVETQSMLYEKEIERKDLEISGLYNQINSHFFYNVLTSIRGMVRNNQSDIVCEMISRVVSYLRYATENVKIYRLYDELRYLENFVNMNKLRSDKDIKLVIDCPYSLNNFRIYKFLLQPFIENSIVHGFCNKNENCEIIIRVKKLYNDIKILIFDNGCGIGNGRIKNDGSVGITNVKKRIALFYGEPYGVKIRGVKGLGTVVAINIPKLEGEYND